MQIGLKACKHPDRRKKKVKLMTFKNAPIVVLWYGNKRKKAVEAATELLFSVYVVSKVV